MTVENNFLMAESRQRKNQSNEIFIDHHSRTHNLSSYDIKALKKDVGLNRIRTYDLCDPRAVPYQLSYQANWELVTL